MSEHYEDALEIAQARAVHALTERLIEVGDVHVLGLEVGNHAASEAMHALSERAPLEIQGSWPLVIAWHRHNKAWQVASRLGDQPGMNRAAAEQLKVVTDRY